MTTLNSVQWKNGFFRLWVLIASLWISVFVILEPPWDILNDYWTARTELSRISLEILKVDKEIVTGGGKSENGIIYHLGKLKVMRDDLEVRKLSMEAAFAIFRTKLTGVITVLFGIPFVLFGLGVSLAWVLGGFKKSQIAKTQEP